MFRFVVLLAVVAVAVAAPGFLHSAVVPLATSHSSRVDYHSKPIVTYAAPAIVAAPIVKTIVPAVKYIAPAAISHSSRVDVHAAPIVTSYHGWNGYGLGSYGHGDYGYGHGAYGYGHGAYGYGHGYGGQWW